eukprot:TRINITY_DN41260_c0_g1_i1.p2 TRINITY_DN41260_c0_g1~~TRINITY_DN41260_c0_g1_i1.p2  ORF type:complete len:152 (+),score=13.63 TRINITY_DN41260_c0_g1_i1:30-458(+)
MIASIQLVGCKPVLNNKQKISYVKQKSVKYGVHLKREPIIVNCEQTESAKNQEKTLTPETTTPKTTEQVLSGMLGLNDQKEQEAQRQKEIEKEKEIDKEITKFARQTASTFAPRASGAVKTMLCNQNCQKQYFIKNATLSFG